MHCSLDGVDSAFSKRHAAGTKEDEYLSSKQLTGTCNFLEAGMKIASLCVDRVNAAK